MKSKPIQSVTSALKVLPVLLLIAIGCAASAGDPELAAPPQERAPTASGPAGSGTALLIFRNDTVRAEVAGTPGERSQGLMGRQQVPDGTGMLFVFTEEENRSFWMRNTLVSLDIAFMDSEFRVVDIQTMEARSEDFHDSRQPAMYALEVPKGWFAAHGVRIGDKPLVVLNPKPQG